MDNKMVQGVTEQMKNGSWKTRKKVYPQSNLADI